MIGCFQRELTATSVSVLVGGWALGLMGVSLWPLYDLLLRLRDDKIDLAPGDAVNVYGELGLPLPDDVGWTGPPGVRRFFPITVVDGSRLYFRKWQLPVNPLTLRYCAAVRECALRSRLDRVVKELDAAVLGGEVLRDDKKR